MKRGSMLDSAMPVPYQLTSIVSNSLNTPALSLSLSPLEAYYDNGYDCAILPTFLLLRHDSDLDDALACSQLGISANSSIGHHLPFLKR